MDKLKITRYLDILMEACFYALLVTVTFSTSLVEIFSSILITVWVVKRLITRDIGDLKNIPFLLIALYWSWTVLSCVNSGYFKESMRGVLKAAEYSLLFITAATSFGDEKVAKRSLYVLVFASLLISADGFFQYITGYDFIRHRNLIYLDYLHRVSASFVHPNDFGVYLLVVALVFAGVIFSVNQRFRMKALFAVPLSMILFSLYLTKSRGAWLSFILAFLALGALKARKVLAVFVALLIITFFMLPYTVQEHVYGAANLQSGTTWERLMLWKGTINMIKEHPVLGFGVNTYSRNFPKYKPPEYPDVRYAHNSYLQMASEIGTVGALIFLVFLITVLIFSLNQIVLARDSLVKDILAGLFAGLLGFSANCIVDTHLYSVNLAVFFHIMLGFCFGLSLYARKNLS